MSYEEREANVITWYFRIAENLFPGRAGGGGGGVLNERHRFISLSANLYPQKHVHDRVLLRNIQF
jgi:hypothetical protein